MSWIPSVISDKIFSRIFNLYFQYLLEQSSFIQTSILSIPRKELIWLKQQKHVGIGPLSDSVQGGIHLKLFFRNI